MTRADGLWMYDLAADPREANNVVHARADRARVLGEVLKRLPSADLKVRATSQSKGL